LAKQDLLLQANYFVLGRQDYSEKKKTRLICVKDVFDKLYLMNLSMKANLPNVDDLQAQIVINTLTVHDTYWQQTNDIRESLVMKYNQQSPVK
jgi:hypothetical protein